jgi:hypothetical protein
MYFYKSLFCHTLHILGFESSHHVALLKYNNSVVSAISLLNHLHVIYVFTIGSVGSYSTLFHLSLPSVLTGRWVFEIRLNSGNKCHTKSENPPVTHDG